MRHDRVYWTDLKLSDKLCVYSDTNSHRGHKLILHSVLKRLIYKLLIEAPSAFMLNLRFQEYKYLKVFDNVNIKVIFCVNAPRNIKCHRKSTTYLKQRIHFT